MNKEHLIIINTYNRVKELNKTIKSINQYLPFVDICIVSKGRETHKEIKGKIKYFHKIENAGREANGYLWGFLHYPDYAIYTFLQDCPEEGEGEYSYHGDKISQGEKFIKKGFADICTGFRTVYSLNNGWPASGHLKSPLNLNYLAKQGNLKKRLLWKYFPTANFTIKGSILRNKRVGLENLFKISKKRFIFAWEMERLWMNLGKKIMHIDNKYNLIRDSPRINSLKDIYFLFRIILTGFLKRYVFYNKYAKEQIISK